MIDIKDFTTGGIEVNELKSPVKVRTIDGYELKPVVKCQNCKYLYDGEDNYCCTLHKGLPLITKDSFCSYGEPK